MNFIRVKTVNKVHPKTFRNAKLFSLEECLKLNAKNYKQSSGADTHIHKTLYIFWN